MNSERADEMRSDINEIENNELPEETGIYMLFNDAEQIYYLGTATDIRARIAGHRSKLLYHKHTNRMLQELFDTSNVYVKVLTLLPHVSKKELKRQELIIKDVLENVLNVPLINRKRR